MIEYNQQNTGCFDLGGKRLKSKHNNYIVGIYVRLRRIIVYRKPKDAIDKVHSG